MPVNIGRICFLPNILKPFQIVITIIVMICVGAAHVQPSGTGLIWFTTIFALIVTLIAIVLLVLEIEQIIIPCRVCTWPLVECGYTLIITIFYFISVWMCVNGQQYNRDKDSAFDVAGFFCFFGFILYGLDFVMFVRIWLTDSGTSVVTNQPPPTVQPGSPGAMAYGIA